MKKNGYSTMEQILSYTGCFLSGHTKNLKKYASYEKNVRTEKIVSLVYGQGKNFFELKKVLLIQKNFL